MSRIAQPICGSMSGPSFRVFFRDFRRPFRGAVTALTAVFSIGLAISASAGVLDRSTVRDCRGVYDLCGTIDETTGKEIIPRRFENLWRFTEGRAAVQIGGRWGWIDEAANVVIPPRFDEVGTFHRGLAPARIDDLVGIVDRSGRIVVEPRFWRAVPLTEDVVAVGDALPQGTRPMHQSGFWGLDDTFVGWRLLRIGGEPSETLYDLREFDGASDLIWAKPEGSNLYGLLRADGKWQVEPTYTRVDRLSDGRAVVAIPDRSTDSSKSEKRLLEGAVDEQGRLVIPPARWRLFFWVNGYGRVERDGRWGLLDRDGRLLGGRWFEGVKDAGIHPYPLVKVDGDWFGIDPSGRLANRGDAGVKVFSCASGYDVFAVVRGTEVRAPDGRKIVIGLSDNFDWRNFSCGELTPVSSGPWVQDDARWGFLDRVGRLLGNALPFQEVTAFNNGHALVKIDGKWGLIDESGRYTIEPHYDRLQPAETILTYGRLKYFTMDDNWLADETYKNNTRRWNFFEATIGARTIGLDVNGKERPLQPRPLPRERPLWCNGGAKLQPVGEYWGMVDEYGRPLLKERYRALSCFRNGTAWVAIDERHEWCAIGPDGRIRDRPACRKAWHPEIHSLGVPESFSVDEYESSVAWNRAYLDYAAGRRDEKPCFVVYGVRCGTMRSGF